MNKMKIVGLLSAAFCLTQPMWVSAEDAQVPATAEGSKNKMGTNSDPTYATPKGDVDKVDQKAKDQRKNEPDTMPSGKRHRTHRKHASETNTTINASDVTPSH